MTQNLIPIHPVTFSILLLLIAGCSSIERAADIAHREAERVARGEAGEQVEGETTGDFDYVPGDRLLFAEDFASVRTGDFPRSLRYVKGNLAVADWRGHRVLQSSGSEDAHFKVPLPERLPERFTVEFDLHDPVTSGPIGGTGVFFGPVPEGAEPMDDYSGSYVRLNYYRGSGVMRDGDELSVVPTESTGIHDGLVRIRIQVEGDAIKVWAGRQQIANVPQHAELGRSDAVTFYFKDHVTGGRETVYIGDIRVAAGGGLK